MKNDLDVVKTLGPVPYWRGQRKFTDTIAEIYRKAIEFAQKTLAR